MLDVVSALEYIEQQGTAVELAIARYAAATMTKHDALKVLEPFQFSDGGWKNPILQTHDVTLLNSVRVLQWLHWLHADQSALATRTAKFFAERQQPHGLWDVDTYDHTFDPRWKVGAEHLHFALNVAIARVLVESVQDVEVYIGRALNQLVELWRKNYEHSPTCPPLCITYNLLTILSLVGQGDDRKINLACQKQLLDQLKQPLDSLDLLGITHATLSGGISTSRLFQMTQHKVLDGQMRDGSWQSQYGTPYHTLATMEALVLMRWSGLL